jgi:hypothetical protein
MSAPILLFVVLRLYITYRQSTWKARFNERLLSVVPTCSSRCRILRPTAAVRTPVTQANYPHSTLV